MLVSGRYEAVNKLEGSLDLRMPPNYRAASGPGSPAGQPGWGGGSDRVLDSTVVREALCYLSASIRSLPLLLRNMLKVGTA